MTTFNAASAASATEAWRRLPKKVLCTITADVHVHPHKQFNAYDDSGISSRVQWAVYALNQVADYTPPDAHLFILGDLLHTKDSVPAEVFKPLTTFFARLKKDHVKPFIITGNHERPDNFSPCTTLDWISESGLAPVCSEPCAIGIGGMLFFLLPWAPDMEASLMKLRSLVQSSAAKYPNYPRVLFGHGMIDGCVSDSGQRMSNAVLTPERAWFAAFNLVFFGDIHKHQQVAPNAWYVGAPLQHNFGERENTPGFIVLYEDLTWERVPIHGTPLFSYTSTGETGIGTAIDENGDDVPLYCRPSDQSIIQRAGDTIPPAKLAVDLRDLRTMAEAYIRAFPPPLNVSPETALTLFLAAHEGRLA